MNYYLDKRQQISIELFDIKGTLIKTIRSRFLHESGNHKVGFNVGHLSDGTYTIGLSGEEGILTKPRVISK